MIAQNLGGVYKVVHIWGEVVHAIIENLNARIIGPDAWSQRLRQWTASACQAHGGRCAIMSPAEALLVADP
jgi:hypothetical protein